MATPRKKYPFTFGDKVKIVKASKGQERIIGSIAIVLRYGHAGYYWIRIIDQQRDLSWRAAWLDFEVADATR